MAAAALDLRPVPDSAQYKEEGQGHERYEEPGPHRRKPLAGRAGEASVGRVLGHRMSARVGRRDLCRADLVRVHIEGDEGG